MAMVEPGQVLVSSTEKDLVAGSGKVLNDLGKYDLKGVPEIWKIFVLEGQRSSWSARGD
jgi:class 3 adenylate cyclase